MIDQMQQRQFRRVRFQMKHTFGLTRAARINTIDSANQAPVVPRFHAVSMPKIVECPIALQNLGSNPGSILPGTWNFSALAHDVIECMIDGERPAITLR